jgi:hypothetical protein
MAQQIDINEVQAMLAERDMQILLLRSELSSLRKQLDEAKKTAHELDSSAKGK